ncbi:MAG: VCBS repeat-containing protein [Armatimonadota bacterium]|nr:VCBS repeat-containing protein [Armatimonadota bacterium]
MFNVLKCFCAAMGLLVCSLLPVEAGPSSKPEWVSPDRHRIVLTVDCRGMKRTNSPASVNLDFRQTLTSLKAKGAFDQHTIEVVGYDASGKPVVFDAARAGYEKYLLPCRIDRYFGVDYVTLNFVVHTENCATYAVYFDTKESRLGKPRRYQGLVGDGDYFREAYGRREIGPSQKDDFCDFDGDGDLDLIKCTNEPFMYYYENAGGNRFVERGRMTSGGSLFVFPMNDNHRSWPIVEFDDWDGDGDQDLFATFNDGPEHEQLVRFENTTSRGGPLTFTNRGRLLTESGQGLGDGWFGTVNIVDWDGDGKKDLLVARKKAVEFHKNIGSDRKVANMKLADAQMLEAEGQKLELWSPRLDCADIDGDGDLDLFAATFDGRLFLYRNTGTKTQPKLAKALELGAGVGGHLGVKVADFDRDGLLDYAVSNLWEQPPGAGQPRLYARTFKNIGTKTEPKFEARIAETGSLFTEQFQICDAARQSGARAVDWNADGKTDLVASTDAGVVYYFRNETDARSPVFAASRQILRDVSPFAKLDTCDWNNDGREDLLIANGQGAITLFVNEGIDEKAAGAPKLGKGMRLTLNGKPIGGTGRNSVLVCDWDNDGRKDLIYGMGGEAIYGPTTDWPPLTDNPARDKGFLFYRNVGTDADPVLAYPKWILFGFVGNQKPVDYVRPNLGSYVDWDGDGKKDFVYCEFENSIRVNPNTGPGGKNIEPEFAWPEEGIKLVEPWTVQMISSVDALDWNGDGDLDIITGQGHGGTGLRFYERDYIEDTVNQTFPVVTVEKFERK